MSVTVVVSVTVVAVTAVVVVAVVAAMTVAMVVAGTIAVIIMVVVVSMSVTVVAAVTITAAARACNYVFSVDSFSDEGAMVAVVAFTGAMSAAAATVAIVGSHVTVTVVMTAYVATFDNIVVVSGNGKCERHSKYKRKYKCK